MRQTDPLVSAVFAYALEREIAEMAKGPLVKPTVAGTEFSYDDLKVLIDGKPTVGLAKIAHESYATEAVE